MINSKLIKFDSWLIVLNSFNVFMRDSVMLNWNAVNKSILVLLLAGTDQILWLIWCLYVYFMPDLHQWIHIEFLEFHIVKLCFTLSSFYIFAALFYFFRKNLFIQKYCAYFTVFYFGSVFMHGGYSIGILSPATIAGYISLVSVGLVLFERKVVYLTFIPITIVLLALILLTAHGVLRYAPSFSEQLNNSVLTENLFWVYSMLYLYIPIFFASIVLFEVLLIQWKNREKVVDTMSKTDALTGIYNRRIIGEKLKYMQSEGRHHIVVLLDLDHFKNINDTYGHEVGDRVLKHVAKLLSESVRSDDVVGRFGGEEFILILKGGELEHAINVAERCRQKILENPLYLADSNEILNISASVGVSMVGPQVSQETLIQQADKALYYAKRKGRNQVKAYSLIEQ